MITLYDELSDTMAKADYIKLVIISFRKVLVTHPDAAAPLDILAISFRRRKIILVLWRNPVELFHGLRLRLDRPSSSSFF